MKIPSQTETTGGVYGMSPDVKAERRGREAISPIVQDVGIEAPPEFFPAHTFVSVDPRSWRLLTHTSYSSR
jgi:hypothetical protein